MFRPPNEPWPGLIPVRPIAPLPTVVRPSAPPFTPPNVARPELVPVRPTVPVGMLVRPSAPPFTPPNVAWPGLVWVWLDPIACDGIFEEPNVAGLELV